MLLSFRVENHKSIRDEQQVLLTPVYDDATPEEADWEALTVTGIFGANASGKSNVLDALGLMQETVRWSMRDNEPGGGVRREPFALSNEAAEEPSVFVVDLMLSGVRHTYGFAVDDDRVVEEWLYSYPRRRKRVVFERDEESFTFGESVSVKLRRAEDLTGPNVLFLTVAARASNEEVEQVYQWFSENLVFADERTSDRPQWLRKNWITEEDVRLLSDMLASADTGIRRLELQEGYGGTEADVSRSGSIATTRKREVRGRAAAFREVSVQNALFPTESNLLFHHLEASEGAGFDWKQESLGTRAFVMMAYEAQRVLKTGGVLVVDEIDTSLHPYLSARTISLFRDEEQNPHGAQLLFTSHDAALLGRIRGEEALKRDHIWFVDKDRQGRSTIYPLSDFKPRGDDNRARRYLTGRYGAVPDVDDELFQRVPTPVLESTGWSRLFSRSEPAHGSVVCAREGGSRTRIRAQLTHWEGGYSTDFRRVLPAGHRRRSRGCELTRSRLRCRRRHPALLRRG